MANNIMISGNEVEEPPTLNMESVLTSTPVKVITFTSYIGQRGPELMLSSPHLTKNFFGSFCRAMMEEVLK